MLCRRKVNRFYSVVIIGVTSSIKGEAKTTTSINLAYTLAENGEKVCLVEGDMRLPTFRKKMKLTSHVGLSEFLTGQAPANDIVESVRFKKCAFSCIQAGALPPNPSELLSSQRMDKLLEALGKTFTYVIVDLPPVTMVSDAVVVGGKLDGVVMVVAQPICTKRLLKESMRQLMLVNLEYIDVKQTFSTSRFNFIQGCCYYNGRLYSCEGFTDDATNIPAIRVVDLKKGVLETTINLPSELGLILEPEFLSVYEDLLYYKDISGNLYYFRAN